MQSTFRVIIAGSRDLESESVYQFLAKKCDDLLYKKHPDIEIVSGTARGIDKLGERYAEDRGYMVRKFPANWEADGKKAGIFRNIAMAEYAHALIAFWDGESRGTAHMIQVAKEKGLLVRVIRIDVFNP